MKPLRAASIHDTSSAQRSNDVMFTGGIEQIREFFPLTCLGILVTAVASFGLSRFGFARLDLVWYVAALCALMLIVVAILSVLLGVLYMRRSIHNEISTTPQKSMTGVACNTGFALPTIPWLPLLETQLSWHKPANAAIALRLQDNQSQEWVTPGTHGNINQIERCITVSDVLGLAAVTLRVHSAANLAVLPNPGALGSIPWLTSLNSGEDLPHPLGAEVGDRTELRRYQSGDSTRFLHWKAFARSRKLMQRAPERSLSSTQRTAAYLVAGAGDGASAAAALTVLLTANPGFDFVFGADGTADLVHSRSEIETAVRNSATRRNDGGNGLASFIDTVLSGGAANFMLFVPSFGGEWESRVHVALRRPELNCKIIIGIDGFDEGQTRSLWYRLVLRTDATTGQKTGQLNQLVKRLEAAGATVSIADRNSGRMYNGRHLESGGPPKHSRENGALRTA